MASEERDEERYKEYLDDVEIAKRELTKKKLYPKKNILCDFYAIPSHNQQAYYAVVYQGKNGLEMVYAKPIIYTPKYPFPIRMYSFSDEREAEQLKHKTFGRTEGQIIMGLKVLNREFSTLVMNLIDGLPEQYYLGKGGICIDGVFQAIRVFDGERTIKEVVYREAEEISRLKSKEYLRKELENLHITIGKLIE